MTSWRCSAGTTSMVHTDKPSAFWGQCCPLHTSLLGPLAGREWHLQTIHCGDQRAPPGPASGRDWMCTPLFHPTVCFPTGEERGSSSGCRHERLWKTASSKPCGVRAVCNQPLGGLDLLICFKALELDLRDVILLGSQKKVPGAREARCCHENEIIDGETLRKEFAVLLLSGQQ